MIEKKITLRETGLLREKMKMKFFDTDSITQVYDICQIHKDYLSINPLDSLAVDNTTWNIKDYLTKLLKMNRSIFPVEANQKHPRIVKQFILDTGEIINKLQKWEQWQNSQISLATLMKWINDRTRPNGFRFNLAEIPSFAGLTVLDIDYGKLSKEAKEACNFWLNLNFNWIQLCPIHKTPNDGYHIYVKLDLISNGDIWVKHPKTGIPYHIGELRHDNYILIPPSQIDDKPYVILQSNFDFIPQAIKFSDLQISINAFAEDDKNSRVLNNDTRESKPKKPKLKKKVKPLDRPYDPKKFFEASIHNAIEAVKKYKKGKFNTTRKQLFKIYSLIGGYQNEGFDYDESLLQNFLNICREVNQDNDNIDIEKLIKECKEDGLASPRTFKNPTHTSTTYSSLCHDLTFFKLSEIYQKHYGRNLRKDSPIAIVYDAIESSKIAIDIVNYNGSQEYISKGLMTRCPSVSQLAKYTGLNPNTIHKCLKQLEEMGVILRYISSQPHIESSIICIGNVVGLFIDSPIPQCERTHYSQYGEEIQLPDLSEIREKVY